MTKTRKTVIDYSKHRTEQKFIYSSIYSSLEEYKKTHGFSYSEENIKSKSNSCRKPNEPQQISHSWKYDVIKNKMSSIKWLESNMRDPQYRLKIYGSIRIKQEEKKNGEIKEIKLYPAFSPAEIEETLDNRQKQFIDLYDPAHLHDWICCEKTGCSEQELRETLQTIKHRN